MKQLIADFPAQISTALENIQSADFQKIETDISNVLITGLGGSGIGGSVVADMAAMNSPVPIVVNKNYQIPAFANEKTLVISCSYSGNTEETLMATREALARKAQVVCIASGGELWKIAKEKNLKVLTMEGGHPPRSMFGYAFSYLCYYFEYYKLANWDAKKDLKNAQNLLEKEQDSIKKEAKEIAQKLYKKTVAVYAVNGNLGIAARWRQQLNENAKMLAWEGEIPEMNHNELVGWEGGTDDFAAVFLRNKTDFDRNQKRVDINQKIIGKKTKTVVEIWSQGDGKIARALWLVHLGDWVSFYLSEMSGVDIIDIKSIDFLKAELAKIPL